MISSSKYLSTSQAHFLDFLFFEPAVIKTNNLSFLDFVFVICAGAATVFFALIKPTRDMHLQ